MVDTQRANQEVVDQIRKSLQNLEADVQDRNRKINRLDDCIYGEGLIQQMRFPEGHDNTQYNWGPRTVHIHASQLFGRGFSMYSSYDKEDLSPLETNPEELKLAELRNKKSKSNADSRNRLVKAIIRDNGGMSPFYNAGQIGSAYGHSVIKEWLDAKSKTTKYTIIESIQNYYAGWSDDNFRERDFDAFVYQISPQKAASDYGKMIPRNPDGQLDIQLSAFGTPFTNVTASPATTEIADRYKADTSKSQRPMATVIDFTGYLFGYCAYDGVIKKCQPGDENRFNALIVGGKLVQVITEDHLIPDYYPVPNIQIPRRPWGQSDISESALQVNQTYIQRMSDWVTLFNKFLHPLYLGINMDAGDIPKKKQRSTQIAPVVDGQDIKLVDSPISNSYEMPKVLDELKEEYVRLAGISRVMFDDPTVSANSNQALMTTLKGMIDIVEAKQKMWDDVLPKMFKRALEKAAVVHKEVKALISDDPAWYFTVEWPSVLRKDDATYNQMLLNWKNAGVYSLETIHEKLGTPDSGEEIDRLRDNYKDPVSAAILGNQTGILAEQVISPVDPNAPVPPAKKININVNADATLDPNLNTEVIDQATGLQPAGPATSGPPDQQSNPVLTSDQNTGQSASQPGSGATAVSPQGAINQANQQAGQ